MTATDWAMTTPLRLALVLAAIALTGLGIGYLAAGPSEPGAPPPPDAVVTAGSLRLTVPDGWAPLGRPATVPGLQGVQARTLQGTFSQVTLAVVAPGGPSLLPAGLAPAGGQPLPGPVTIPFRSGSAWSYRLTLPGRHPVPLEVDAIPTTRGTAVVACAGTVEDLRSHDCETAMDAMSVVGAKVLRVGPDAALLSALPAAVERLSRARLAARRRLAGARSRGGRAGAAAEVGAAYGSAERSLQPLSAGTPMATGTLQLLGRLRAEHATLARAIATRDAPGASFAASAVRNDERSLERRLVDWRRAIASR